MTPGFGDPGALEVAAPGDDAPLEGLAPVGMLATASYLPKRWMTAAEIAVASGIPEEVVVTKFGLRGKHVAGADEHVSDMAALVGRRALEAAECEPSEVDAVIYYGSTWKDYPVWQAAPRVSHLVGCDNAFALELDYVSCGTPVALRVARDLMQAEPEVRTTLLVAACRESYLLDYHNTNSRFAFNFADGAAGVVLRRGVRRNQVLGSHMITDGSLSLQVKVPAGGSVRPSSAATVEAGLHHLDVTDPAAMKERLDEVSLPNFVRAAESALKRSGLGLDDVSYLCGIHMKRSMHEALVSALGVAPARAAYLDDTGHMSGVDPLLALDRAARAGQLAAGDVVLLLAAGTGYTWAATAVRWGACPG